MKKPLNRFRARYGTRPRNPTLGNLWDTLYDAYVYGYLMGFDDSNKMWQKKGKKK